jgi:hypothetical protein
LVVASLPGCSTTGRSVVPVQCGYLQLQMRRSLDLPLVAGGGAALLSHVPDPDSLEPSLFFYPNH